MDIELSRIFVKVIQHGGFSQAANILKVQKSTVSKAITRLEKLTGTKLLMRTTRSHTLTEAGKRFYEKCLEPILILEEAHKSLFGIDSIATGQIKITAPEDLGTYLIAPAIAEISKNNPNLNFELQHMSEIVDLVKNGFDLAVRIGHLKESRLKMKRIGRLELILVASPGYFENNSRPKTPADLTDHACLSLSGLRMTKSWKLQKGKQTNTITIRPIIESNQMSSLLQASIAGAGILLAPSFICKSELENGNLIRVLPSWSYPGLPVSLVSPVSMNDTARIKLVADVLLTKIKSVLDA